MACEMPITISPQNPSGLFGPGLTTQLQSSFIGPLPSTTIWTLTATRPADEAFVYTNSFRNNSNPVQFTPHVQSSLTTNESDPSLVVDEGLAVNLNATLQTQGGGAADDSGTGTAIWTNTAGLTNVIQHQGGSGGGLTDVQAQQLTEVHSSTVIDQVVNAITLTEISPGITGDPVSAFLPELVFGVIVRIANVPIELVPNTPDGDYWLPSLAVCRVFRGSDLWLRVPIHTSSKLISFWTENLLVGISAVTFTEWLLNLSVQVTFRAGVTGQVFLMRFP